MLGPSGSGKSTLLRAIAGLEPLDGGTIEFGNPDERLAVVFQAPRSRSRPRAEVRRILRPRHHRFLCGRRRHRRLRRHRAPGCPTHHRRPGSEQLSRSVPRDHRPPTTDHQVAPHPA
ncbi:ATP-binding cassette domain-containing protein [Kocuria arenosa]|uniref:ATP-binding cassette domain-containing protein n=1 Tax=Kocuria arenosa TaxID=3071446 RepID=UPI003F672276